MTREPLTNNQGAPNRKPEGHEAQNWQPGGPWAPN